MVLAFGILLTIMVAALLFSLYSCVKNRLQKSDYKRQTFHGVPSRHPIQHVPHQFPYMDPRRGSPIASPYYRFQH